MGTIISTGIGSGLDISGLVSQLVAAEGQPVASRLDRDEAGFQAELSALGSFRAALDTFRSSLSSLKELDTFLGRSVAQSNEDFVAALATTTAGPGTYAIEVEQLASAHRLVSTDFASATAVVGTGTLTVSLGSEGFALAIDATNNTLAGIRDAINDADTNPGVSATIVTGLTGSRLVLTSQTTGAANPITVTASGGDGGLTPLIYDPANSITNLTELDPAQNARILIDGLAAESETNTISEAIEGLDIDLLATNAVGETTIVSVGFDPAGAKQAVQQLVDSYNSLVDALAGLTAFDPETQVAGPLLGDSTVRGLTTQLRRELNNPLQLPGNPFGGLFAVGIATDVEGRLTLDETELDAALAQDFDSVGALFSTADVGIAVKLDSLLEPYLSLDGILDNRTDGLNASIEDITDRRETLNERLVRLETRLLREFNALDSLLAQFNSTSGFLSQQLNNLPGFDTLLNTR